MLLSSAKSYPGLIVVLCASQCIYLSDGPYVWTMDMHGCLKSRAMVPIPWYLKQAAHFRHFRRLGRFEVRELIQLPSGVLVGTIQRRIIHLDKGEEVFKTAFTVADGGKPKGLVQTPQGHIFVGEYWGNPQRHPLRIWASDDQGKNWELAYSLPAGSAKHIHKLVWDPYRQGLWVLTGDLDGECALLFTADEFKSVSEIARGGQMFRACNIFCLPEGIYYGTDTERAKNWFVYLDIDKGNQEKICPLPGSCLYAARMAGKYFISTNVEPSKVNHYRNAVLWSSTDLHNWSKMVEFKKDLWPGESFGFGRVILPSVQGECPVVLFSTMAVRHVDLTTFLINTECIQPSTI